MLSTHGSCSPHSLSRGQTQGLRSVLQVLIGRLSTCGRELCLSKAIHTLESPTGRGTGSSQACSGVRGSQAIGIAGHSHWGAVGVHKGVLAYLWCLQDSRVEVLQESRSP